MGQLSKSPSARAPSPAQIKAAEDEFLRRKGARESMREWLDYRDSGAKPAKHHRLLIEALEKVDRGEIRRLMFILPPGAAKSTYGSVEFPPWYMGRNPKHVVLGCSNTDDLAQRFGRKVRNIVGSAEFTSVFEFGLSKDATAAGDWETSEGGEYKAAGIGAAIAGRRADLGLIDDPVKSREAADSERERNKVWDWYVNDFETRLKPNAKQILIQTRWHEDDLAGRILKRDADLWTVIRIPMECDDYNDPLGRNIGERLWPEWFTDEMVTQAKKEPRSWNALYQGNPIPESGNYFKKEWFIEYRDSELPSTLHIYAASDFAVTDGSGDFTEHGIFGVDYDGDVWVLDWWYGQTAPDVWIDKMADLILTHKPTTWFGEAGPIRRSVEPFMKKRLSDRRAFCHMEWLPSIHDKSTRARSIQAIASMGKVKVPKDKPFMAHVMTQWLQFPVGKLDDAVDAFSLIGRGLEFVRKASHWRNEPIKYRNLAIP